MHFQIIRPDIEVLSFLIDKIIAVTDSQNYIYLEIKSTFHNMGQAGELSFSTFDCCFALRQCNTGVYIF